SEAPTAAEPMVVELPRCVGSRSWHSGRAAELEVQLATQCIRGGSETEGRSDAFFEAITSAERERELKRQFYRTFAARPAEGEDGYPSLDQRLEQLLQAAERFRRASRAVGGVQSIAGLDGSAVRRHLAPGRLEERVRAL